MVSGSAARPPLISCAAFAGRVHPAALPAVTVVVAAILGGSWVDNRFKLLGIGQGIGIILWSSGRLAGTDGLLGLNAIVLIAASVAGIIACARLLLRLGG